MLKHFYLLQGSEGTNDSTETNSTSYKSPITLRLFWSLEALLRLRKSLIAPPNVVRDNKKYDAIELRLCTPTTGITLKFIPGVTLIRVRNCSSTIFAIFS